jgi:threonyl-tRNA synthetase
VEVDDSNQTLGKKIREAETHKIPVMLVVGEKEATDGTVTVRTYGERAQGVMTVAELTKKYAEATPR